MLRYQLFTVRAGKLPALLAWAEELGLHGKEVRETLREENVMEETFVRFAAKGVEYVMAMQSLRAPHVKADMQRELNRKHFAVIQECLEPAPSTLLYLFRADTNSVA